MMYKIRAFDRSLSLKGFATDVVKCRAAMRESYLDAVNLEK